MKTIKRFEKQNNRTTEQVTINPWAILFICLILVLLLLSFFWILYPSDAASKGQAVVAQIYQNGTLLETIDLSRVTAPYELTVTGENSRQNIISVRPGSIGMLHADCPDKLCVKQGFYSTPSLPITCLPNKVVIELKVWDDTREDIILPDIITY